MYRGPAAQPLEISPRVMPRGTLPTNGLPPISRARGASLINPLEPTPANLAHGRELFINNCSPCHGAGGRGDGPVARLFEEKYPVANLVTQAVFQSDGYIYATIRDGGLVMPAYDDAMSSKERWQVVLFVRYLEGKIPAKVLTETPR